MTNNLDFDRAVAKMKSAKKALDYETQQFIYFIRSIDPELTPSQAIILAAITVNQLPELFKQNPELVEWLTELGTQIKLNGQ